MRPDKPQVVQASGLVSVRDVHTFLWRMYEAGYPRSAKVHIMAPRPGRWEHWHIEFRRAEAHPRLPHVGYRVPWAPSSDDYGQLEGLVTVERLAYAMTTDVDDLRISQAVDQLFFGGRLDASSLPMILTRAVPCGWHSK